jgi:hypothetical protein
LLSKGCFLPDDPLNLRARFCMNVEDGGGVVSDDVPLGVVVDVESVLGGVEGVCAADASIENNPLRRCGWTRGVVVDGVGVDMVLVRDALSGDCVVVLLGSVGFVDDLDLPVVFDREAIKVSIVKVVEYLIDRLGLHRCP